MARPATTWPAAVRRSAIARPLVSVASVRVSLTVTMKQRTDSGARALCSVWLIESHCSAGACYDPRMAQASGGDERARRRTGSPRSDPSFVVRCSRHVVRCSQDVVRWSRLGRRAFRIDVGGRLLALAAAAIVLASAIGAAPHDPFTLDRAAERWVEQTLKKLSADEKIGQLIVPSFESNFL